MRWTIRTTSRRVPAACEMSSSGVMRAFGSPLVSGARTWISISLDDVVGVTGRSPYLLDVSSHVCRDLGGPEVFVEGRRYLPPAFPRLQRLSRLSGDRHSGALRRTPYLRQTWGSSVPRFACRQSSDRSCRRRVSVRVRVPSRVRAAGSTSAVRRVPTGPMNARTRMIGCGCASRSRPLSMKAIVR